MKKVDSLTPCQIVKKLDEFIIGQDSAKKAVSIAIRDRWRRQQLDPYIQKDIVPKNILMSGPTGVGKTEIARRLAALVKAPFIKIEATKFTEVGYVGRNVESIVANLLEIAIHMVQKQRSKENIKKAEQLTEQVILDSLFSTSGSVREHNNQKTPDLKGKYREEMLTALREGKLEDRRINVVVDNKTKRLGSHGNPNIQQIMPKLEAFLENVIPNRQVTRDMPVYEARNLILEQELDRLIDHNKMIKLAIDLTEQFGVVFLDEIDKLCNNSSFSHHVSREGVQRDLLPLIEGTTVNTIHGMVKTDHILFIAAGAFSVNKLSDLMPELQGRFPIRVELEELSKEQFYRILTEPRNSLIKQAIALLSTEGVALQFADSAIHAMASKAYEINSNHENIGARRLYATLEMVLAQVSFDAPDKINGNFTIDHDYVEKRLLEVNSSEDLKVFGFSSNTARKNKTS